MKLIILSILFLALFTKQAQATELKILDIEDKNNLHFGRSFQTTIFAQTDENVPVVVSISIKGITEKQEITFYDAKSRYEITLPIFILESDNPSGYYDLIIESKEQKDSEKIFIGKITKSIESNEVFFLDAELQNESMLVDIFNPGMPSQFKIWTNDEQQIIFIPANNSRNITLSKFNSTIYVKNIATGYQERILLPDKKEERTRIAKKIFRSSSEKASNLGIYIFSFLLLILVIIQNFKK